MHKKQIYPVKAQGSKYEFRVWASNANSVNLVINEGTQIHHMNREEYGYWSLQLENIKPGTRYKYQIDEKDTYPDPASLSQPDGVHGQSELLQLDDFKWNDHNWKNIPITNMIQYELHTGTFTSEGTFDGICSKTDYLNELGVNTIEILPVAQFSGHRNWGYDGVYPFAVQNSYGGAFKLMNLVNECHKKGIAVILDVVYNHFGPEGNYAGKFSPYFSKKYSTPWGHPINFDGAYSDGVRNFVIQNALMWCRNFHIDGLRLDAVHAIFDFSTRHILQELAENLNELSMQTKRPYYLIAESDLNDVRYISPFEKGGYGLDAQWSDDFHHTIHTLVTGEKNGYYIDYGEPQQLAKAIKNAFVFDGRYSEYRKKSYGNSTCNNSGEQFIIFNQNHDQVGNRKNGERLINLTNFETAKLIAGTMLTSPYVPMLFMGEEYGELCPFYYFVSHQDEQLNKLVREGRKKEFKFIPGANKTIPEPDSPETFEKSKLSWKINDKPENKIMFEYYKSLIDLRKNHPVLKNMNKDNVTISENNKLFMMERWCNNSYIVVVMNYSEIKQTVRMPAINRLFKKIMDSSDKKWNGRGETSPDKVSDGDEITVDKNTFIIYSD